MERDEISSDALIADDMIAFDYKTRLNNRIACDEIGYPACEARYVSIEDFERQTGLNYYEDVCTF